MRLAQGSEKVLEASVVEFGTCGLRRVFRRRASRHELLPPILEVLRKFLRDFALTRRRQAQRHEARSDV
jgi:hypothetical protein